MSDIEQVQQQSEQIIRQQQQQQEFELQNIEEQRERVFIEPEAVPFPEPSAVDGAPCFPIESLDVRGVSLFDSKDIDAVVAAYTGQCLGLDKINQVLKALTTLYLDHGYATTRAYLPQQNLSSGILIIQVIEGTIESFDASQAGGLSVQTAFPGLQGEPLNLRDIEQGIEQVNRLAANRARMELIPGSATGKSKIKLYNEQKRQWQGGFRYDNSGQESTGEEQGRIYLSRDHLFGVNDFLSLSLQSNLEGGGEGKKSETVSLRFEVPYGYWMFALDVSDFEYGNRVEGHSQVFDSSGTSDKQALTVSRVLQRNQSGKTEVITAITRKKSVNYIEGVKLDTSSRTLGVAQVELRHREHFSGNQSLQSSLSYVQGLDAFGSPERVSSEAPDPEYSAWQGDIGYSKRFLWLDHSWSFSSNLAMQYSDDELFGSEQFSIGSLYSVRGFKGESLSARSGSYWRNDLSVSFPLGQNGLGINSMSTSFGLDAGAISGEPDDPNNHETLEGMAIGLALGGKHISIDMTFARALKRPDSFDGDKDQFHFSLTFKF